MLLNVLWHGLEEAVGRGGGGQAVAGRGDRQLVRSFQAGVYYQKLGATLLTCWTCCRFEILPVNISAGGPGSSDRLPVLLPGVPGPAPAGAGGGGAPLPRCGLPGWLRLSSGPGLAR